MQYRSLIAVSGVNACIASSPTRIWLNCGCSSADEDRHFFGHRGFDLISDLDLSEVDDLRSGFVSGLAAARRHQRHCSLRGVNACDGRSCGERIHDGGAICSFDDGGLFSFAEYPVACYGDEGEENPP